MVDGPYLTDPPGSLLHYLSAEDRKVRSVRLPAKVMEVLYITLDKDEGKLLVLDPGNKCIYVYDLQGILLSEIDTSGHVKGPRGISMDPDGHLLVADWYAKSIHQFTVEGKYVKQVLTIDFQPWDIATDLRGNLAIVGQITLALYEYTTATTE